MAAATLERTKTKEAPKPDHAWRDSVLLGYQHFSKPDLALVGPPAKTPVRDLLAIKHFLDPHAAVPGRMLAFMGQTSHLFKGSNSDESYFVSQLPDNRNVADYFASAAAGEGRKVAIQEDVEAFQEAIDALIVRRLEDGQGQDKFIASSAFGKGGTTHVWIKVRDYYLAAGFINRLPDDHPIHSWPQQLFLEDSGPGKQLLVVLGRGITGWSDTEKGKPRGYYPLDNAKRLTHMLRVEQAQNRLATSTRLDKEEHAKCLDTLEGLESSLPPRVVYPPPKPILSDGMDWRASILNALQLFKAPRKHTFIDAPEDTCLDDLITVRALFGDTSDLQHPVKMPAATFASRFAGTNRKDLLAELLREMMVKLDRELAVALEAGFLFAAEQAAGS